MYESPLLRRARAAAEEALEEAEFTERLIDALDNDPEVRAAIVRALAADRARKPSTYRSPRRKGR